MHHKKPVGNLYQQHGLNDINRGRSFRPGGTQHIMLFDCSESSVHGVGKIRKPIVTAFGTMFSPTLASLLDELPSAHHVQVHIVPWLDPDANAMNLSQSQVRRGYHQLVNSYKVDSQLGPGGTKDAIYLFGDAEGAHAANAVARILANVGVLQPIFWDDEGDHMINIGQHGTLRQREFYSITRGWDTRVELLGLWTDEKLRSCLTLVRDPSGIVTIFNYSRSACEHCGQYFRDVSDGACYGICSSRALGSKLRELLSTADDGGAPLTINDAISEQCVSPSLSEANAAQGHPDASNSSSGTHVDEAGNTTSEPVVADLEPIAEQKEVRDLGPI